MSSTFSPSPSTASFTFSRSRSSTGPASDGYVKPRDPCFRSRALTLPFAVSNRPRESATDRELVSLEETETPTTALPTRLAATKRIVARETPSRFSRPSSQMSPPPAQSSCIYSSFSISRPRSSVTQSQSPRFAPLRVVSDCHEKTVKSVFFVSASLLSLPVLLVQPAQVRSSLRSLLFCFCLVSRPESNQICSVLSV